MPLGRLLRSSRSPSSRPLGHGKPCNSPNRRKKAIRIDHRTETFPFIQSPRFVRYIVSIRQVLPFSACLYNADFHHGKKAVLTNSMPANGVIDWKGSLQLRSFATIRPRLFSPGVFKRSFSPGEEENAKIIPRSTFMRSASVLLANPLEISMLP